MKDHTINDHGRTLVNVCNNNKLVVVNHLIYREKQLDGDLTFKRKDEWISEIDLCIVKQNSLLMIKEVAIKQNVGRSDHAPLCVTLDMDKGICASARELLARSAQLGDSHYQKLVPYKLQKSVCHNEVDTEKMRMELQSHAPPEVNGTTDVSEVLTAGNNTIMECARRSIIDDLRVRTKHGKETSPDGKDYWMEID